VLLHIGRPMFHVKGSVGMTDEPAVAGLPFTTLRSDDEAVEALRKRIEDVGVSYGALDEITQLGEGSSGKYLGAVRARNFTLGSLLRLCEALGLRVAFHVDEGLTRRMQRQWSKRDGSKVHARRSPSLGPAVLRRVLPAAAAEMGRRGGQAWANATTHEERRAMGLRGAQARWGRRDPGIVSFAACSSIAIAAEVRHGHDVRTW
jgi:hypothetical protein